MSEFIIARMQLSSLK